MNTMYIICDKCGGIGYTNQVFSVDEDGCTVKVQKDICDKCNGLGHEEYAIFSVEEAKAILKHCGLSTES